MKHVTTETVVEEKERIVYTGARHEKYTEEREVTRHTDTTCDICGRSMFHADEVTVEIRTSEENHRCNTVRRGVRFDICPTCWPSLAEWISSHRGVEPREWEEDW